jgi:hypothetical protein
MFYPIALALTALSLLLEGALWEIVLQPTNPAVPITLIVLGLGGFYLAAEECR